MIAFRVTADPHPQGSHHVEQRRGRATVVANNERALAAWRNNVAADAYQFWWPHRATWAPITGPAVMHVTFYLRRPKTTKWPDYPAGPPDLSKLVRATEDGIVENLKAMGAVLLADDALLVDTDARKRWATPAEPPGALVTLYALEAAP